MTACAVSIWSLYCLYRLRADHARQSTVTARRPELAGATAVTFYGCDTVIISWTRTCVAMEDGGPRGVSTRPFLP